MEQECRQDHGGAENNMEQAYKGQLEKLQEQHRLDTKKITDLEQLVARQKQLIRMEYEKRDAIEAKYWKISLDKEYLERMLYGEAQPKWSLKQLCRFQYHKRKLLKKPSAYWKPVFDAEEYAKLNRDVSKQVGKDRRALLRHFILYGMNQGRRANSSFDVRAYMKYSPDVTEYYEGRKWECYIHYIEIGWKQGRRTNW